ncbi:uncharacterized protein LOC126956141 [Macaca thibetana thibetana]|uniref:uncharacterized protein LOC126956141 n=1 Tax=Macaca thibetana thibetana TaxID=257877 RepID=UPI0021BCBCDB|nr:uncharacterized protein LOC126956141 [Macaca thibetana thibetana]
MTPRERASATVSVVAAAATEVAVASASRATDWYWGGAEGECAHAHEWECARWLRGGRRTLTAGRPPDSGRGLSPLIFAWVPALSGAALNSGKWELQARSVRQRNPYSQFKTQMAPHKVRERVMWNK